MRSVTLKTAASYLTVYLVWGSTYFFIKMAVASFTPYSVVGFRFTVGGLLLLSLALISRAARRPLSLRSIASSMLLGTLLLIGANGLVTIAEQKVDSYVVALVMASVPLAVAFFDRVLFRKTITWIRLAGIFTGFAGVALLLYDGQSLRASLDPHTLMVLAAMLLWSLGTSLAHRLPLPPDSRLNSGIQMLFAGLVSLLLVLLSGRPLLQVSSPPSLPSLLGLSYLAIVGSLAITAYTFLIVNEPTSRVVSYALVNPGIAVALGLLLGQETPAVYMAAGLPLILVGLGTMLYGESILKALKQKKKV